MRRLAVALLLALCAFPSLAGTPQYDVQGRTVIGMNAVPVGCAQITSLSASTALSVPSNAKGPATMVVAIPETQAVRWRDDGAAPTASVGMPVPAGQPLFYAGSLTAIRFIEQSASAKLNVCFYQ